MRYKRMIRLGKWFGLALTVVVVGVLVCNLWILLASRKYIYENGQFPPKQPVALVLGTSKSLDGRYLNPYFTDRIDAAQELYSEKKVRHLIVSGDNSLVTYNEPRDMRQALIEEGVPARNITMDFAGFRTFDSVVRCKEIFNQQKITIISQPFHTPRAVFIARAKGMEAYGYNSADDLTSWLSSIYWREVIARCKTVLDLYILNKSPKYLGEKEKINFSDES